LRDVRTKLIINPQKEGERGACFPKVPLGKEAKIEAKTGKIASEKNLKTVHEMLARIK